MRRRLLVAVLVFYATMVAALIVAPQVLAKRNADATTTCRGALAHATIRDLTVPDGAVCRISGSTVNGSVTVYRNAYFEAWDTRVKGTIHATDALTVFLHDQTSVTGSVLVDGAAQLFLYRTTVGGTVRITHAVAPGYGHVQVCETRAGGIEITASGPDVLVGDPERGCPGNTVTGDVVIVDNNVASELQVSGNIVSGSLLVTNTTGAAPKNVTNNTLQGRLDLSNNSAPFDASNNQSGPRYPYPATPKATYQ
jgi:hypothetical protein